MLKLGSTTREGKIFTTNFNPILTCFKPCKLGVRNIMIPYLQEENIQTSSTCNQDNENETLFLAKQCITLSLLVGHLIGV